MRKTIWDYFILFFQMVFVGAFILYMFANYVDAHNENFLDRSMYSKNVAGIQLSDTSLAAIMGEIVELDPNDIQVDGSYAVYKDISYDYNNEIIRGILVTMYSENRLEVILHGQSI